ncbi:hypothetical protein CEXT_500131 [Caerostris extrusa]|uniref:Uncharacterized protein n=1 Tax=Caerostris extrusa TaxID=172846 RepID=A0AAV4NF15_CAEEX|nr:hypothetical protein CEXT_500131 [Caerostris extrusa]
MSGEAYLDFSSKDFLPDLKSPIKVSVPMLENDKSVGYPAAGVQNEFSRSIHFKMFTMRFSELLQNSNPLGTSWEIQAADD